MKNLRILEYYEFPCSKFKSYFEPIKHLKILTNTSQGCHRSFLMKTKVGPRLLKTSSILLGTCKRYTLNSRESIDLIKLNKLF